MAYERSGPYHSFDSIADAYDSTRVIPDDAVDEVVRLCGRAAKLKSGGFLLDAGVGTGRFGAPLSRLFPGQIIGVDVSLAMMGYTRAKTPQGALHLAQGDLQRLPLKTGSLQCVLAVHILHLIKDWRAVLAELKRVIRPRSGVLLLGGERGGRSVVIEYYFQRARAANLLTPVLGINGLTPAINYLKRPDPKTGAMAAIELLSSNSISWKRSVPIQETLTALDQRAYSQIQAIPDLAHMRLMEETTNYALDKFGSPDVPETLETKFVLYGVRWG